VKKGKRGVNVKFYRIIAAKKKTGENTDNTKEITREQKQDVATKTDAFLEENEESATIFCSTLGREIETVCCVKDNRVDEKQFGAVFMEKLGLEYDRLESKEVMMISFLSALRAALRAGLIVDDDRIAEFAGVTTFYDGCTNYFNEKIADDNKTEEELLQDVATYHLSLEYEEELRRIFAGKKRELFIGNPVSYLIISKDDDARRMMIRGLVSALYKKGRLQSKRYMIVDIALSQCTAERLEELYKINQGATIYLKTSSRNFSDSAHLHGFLSIKKACEIAKKHSAKTLTVFCISQASDEYRNMIENRMLGSPLVVFTDNLYTKEAAQSLLEEMAKKEDFVLSEALLEKVQRSERSYAYCDLVETYNTWRTKYVSTEVFPEYKKYVTHVEEKKQKSLDSNAYKKLQKMIGLAQAKKVIDGAINYFKLQKEYKKRGIKFSRPAMHMCFTGNPGTAKTTVARLIAAILKENEILSEGRLIEVGRSQLVGEYVGTTAPKVREAFEEAKGSILFIDEAYSLLDDKKGLYGTEAINTIVQEMENRREDTIVIFAGYKKEMEDFLAWNPGLKSRIAFHVPFDDYTEEELFQITEHIAKERGMIISKDAKEKLLKIYAEARADKAFGNGRYARNILEKAKFHQANRLAKNDVNFISDEEICTLKAEDFEAETGGNEPRPRLGFGE
ncbi:MAG: AAA family ATPase, partial [Clostridia bacterium]|nr:AAA family ATPase [Clostridia bacterium]